MVEFCGFKIMVLANLTLRWALLVELAGTYLGNEVSGSRQRHGYSSARRKLGGARRFNVVRTILTTLNF